MMNNTTRVSPRNGVDFSHIRKAQQGMRVPKFQTGGGIGNRKNTYITQGDWWNAHNNANIAQWQRIAEEHPEMTLEELNNFIALNHNLYLSTGYSAGGRAMRGDANNNVNLYLQDYHNKYGFGNGDEFWSGWENAYSGNSLNTGDLRAGEGLTFTGDNYFGEQTNRRLANYFTDEELTRANQAVSSRGWHWELADYNDSDNRSGIDGRKFYKLVEDLTPPEIITPPENGERPEEPIVTPPTQGWKPVDYPIPETPPRRFNIPTFPIYNGALLGIANLTNKRVLDTQLKAPSMRYQSPTLYGKVTDAYAERSGNLLALKERTWANEQMANNTSDLSQSMAIKSGIQDAELLTKLANNKAKQDEFNLTSLNLENINNQNKQNWTNTANLNREAYVSESRDRLNKIAQYQAQRGQNLQENIMANYNDWTAWNRQNQLQDYADWRANEWLKVQSDMNRVQDDFRNIEDIENYQGYKDFWNGMLIEDANGDLVIDNDPNNKFAAAYSNYVGEGNQLDPALMKKFFLENYDKDEYKPWLGGFKEGWEKYKNDAQANYLKLMNLIQTRWGLTDARNKPIGFDGQIGYRLYNYLNPRTSYNSIFSMKQGGRFLAYLEHNRKAEKDIRDVTMKTMSDSRKMLARDLDALDRESLLLLRAIFK